MEGIHQYEVVIAVDESSLIRVIRVHKFENGLAFIWPDKMNSDRFIGDQPSKKVKSEN